MNDPALQAIDLAKTFRPSVVAVSGLDLTVPTGSVYGLIGRNGAGKSTCLRMLMGLLRPDRGRALVLGTEFRDASHQTRQRVSYVSQEQQLPWWMSADELIGQLEAFYQRWDNDLARDLMRRFELATDRPLATLSGGDQRRVAVALALAANPDVVILDEPAAGLDPVSRRQLIEAMVEFLGDGGERTVLFSTHLLADLERVADHVGFMDRGRLLMGGPLEQLQSDMRRVQLIFSGDKVPDDFHLPGRLRAHAVGPVLSAVVRIHEQGQLERLHALEGVRVSEQPLGLEDLFIELLEPETGHETSDQWWKEAGA